MSLADALHLMWAFSSVAWQEICQHYRAVPLPSTSKSWFYPCSLRIFTLSRQKQSSTSTLILLATLAPPLERRLLATQQPQRHVSLRPIRLSHSMLMGSTRLAWVSTVIFRCIRCRVIVRNRLLPRARFVEANCAEQRPVLILSRCSCGIF
jgi:hypothetical protein